MKIEIGNVIELRNGDKLVYHHSGEAFSLDGEFTFHDVLSAYDENYEMINASKDYDIIRIYSDYTLTTVIWERDDGARLTDVERAILSGLSHEYKWIARDEDGDLYIYKNKPKKESLIYMWKGQGNCDFTAYNHLFQFITWDATEPHSIPTLIAHY